MFFPVLIHSLRQPFSKFPRPHILPVLTLTQPAFLQIRMSKKGFGPERRTYSWLPFKLNLKGHKTKYPNGTANLKRSWILKLWSDIGDPPVTFLTNLTAGTCKRTLLLFSFLWSILAGEPLPKKAKRALLGDLATNLPGNVLLAPTQNQLFAS